MATATVAVPLDGTATNLPRVGRCGACLNENVPLGPKPGDDCLICERSSLVADEYVVDIVRDAVEAWIQEGRIHPDDLVDIVRRSAAGVNPRDLAPRWDAIAKRMGATSRGIAAHFADGA